MLGLPARQHPLLSLDVMKLEQGSAHDAATALPCLGLCLKIINSSLAIHTRAGAMN